MSGDGKQWTLRNREEADGQERVMVWMWGVQDGVGWYPSLEGTTEGRVNIPSWNISWKKGHRAVVERPRVKLIQSFKDFSEVHQRYCHEGWSPEFKDEGLTGDTDVSLDIERNGEMSLCV